LFKQFFTRSAICFARASVPGESPSARVFGKFPAKKHRMFTVYAAYVKDITGVLSNLCKVSASVSSFARKNARAMANSPPRGRSAENKQLNYSVARRRPVRRRVFPAGSVRAPPLSKQYHFFGISTV
jgi:hypothetical protein